MALTERLKAGFAAAFRPPVFESEARTQQAFVLYVNLWFAIIVEVLVVLMGLANLEMLVIYWVSATASTLWFFTLLVLTRRGYTVLASWLCILTSWGMTTGFALIGGGLHAPIIAEYLVAIMVAGLLLGWRVGAVTMAASLAACTALAWLETRGMLPGNVVTYTPFSTLLLVVVVFADIMMLLLLAVYSIGKSYRRAQTELAERVQAEEALQERTEELNRFFSFAIDLLCIVGTDGRFVRLNPAWETTLGFSLAELERRRFIDLVHPDEQAATRAVAAALAGGQSVTGFVNRLRCRDGSCRWIEWQAAPGHGGMVYAAARDITERRNAEEERARMDAQLQQAQKLESLGILAGGIAHDFNNLLAGVVGNADILLSDLPPDSPLRPMAEMILEIAQRASGLCAQMLAYSGRGIIAHEPLDLNSAVLETTQILEASISKKAALHHDLAGDLPAIQGDPTQIRQIVMNLVINAAEALEEKTGDIDIRTGVVQCDGPYLETLHPAQERIPGKYVFLEVRDTGHGMDEATRARIFDPFFSTKFVGRGLGLAAVLGIVRNHRGGLRADSVPGQGTTFRVLFPALEAQASPADAARRNAVGDWRGCGAVLLVDDESAIRVVGANLLERLGFQVFTAEDGQRAMEVYAASAGAIVCVILDLTMPRMDGEETFDALRRHGCTAPIIISSGYSEYEVSERFAGKRVAGFLQKPYRLGALRQALQAALAG